MPDSNPHAAEVLSALIETTLDSANGYDKAAELARNPTFQTLFKQRAEARRGLTGQLADEVRTFGGEPPLQGSLFGPAHRAFLQLRDKVSGQSDKAVVEEVARGEQVINDRFEQATFDLDLPVQVRQRLKQAQATLRDDFQEITALRGQFD
jgi:uncharacterized protein (TIGR02284 family)